MSNEVPNTLSEALEDTENRAKYDAACKRILSEKVILANIMKGCIPEYANCSIEEIEQLIEGTPEVGSAPVLPDAKPKIHGEDTADKSEREGSITYDVLFRALTPEKNESISLIINVEAQNDYNPGYPIVSRGIYYCARLISRQYGTEFSRSAYGKIKKVYSIWICMHANKQDQNAISCFNVTKEDLCGNIDVPKDAYDLLSVIMVNLGDSEKTKNNLLGMLSVLLSDELKAATKRTVLQDRYNIPMTIKFGEELTEMCNLSEGLVNKGVAKGIGIGIDRGEDKKELELFLNLREATSWSDEQVLDTLKIPENRREALLKRAHQ